MEEIEVVFWQEDFKGLNQPADGWLKHTVDLS